MLHLVSYLVKSIFLTTANNKFCVETMQCRASLFLASLLMPTTLIFHNLVIMSKNLKCIHVDISA